MVKHQKLVGDTHFIGHKEFYILYLHSVLIGGNSSIKIGSATDMSGTCIKNKDRLFFFFFESLIVWWFCVFILDVIKTFWPLDTPLSAESMRTLRLAYLLSYWLFFFPWLGWSAPDWLLPVSRLWSICGSHSASCPRALTHGSVLLRRKVPTEERPGIWQQKR